MIDIHCHILPGVDDGAASWSDTLAIANEAVSQGIHTVIATPHHNNGPYQNEKDSIIGAVDFLNNKLSQEGIPLTVLPGQEVKIYDDLVNDLKNELLLPLNESTGYIMLELPNTHVPIYANQLIFDMQIAGFKPIIVHPERNGDMLQNPTKLYNMVKNGALTQVDADSLCGKYGKKMEKFALQLIEANLGHFIASNVHDMKKQGYNLLKAYKVVENQLGRYKADILYENSELLVQGKAVIRDVPERIRQRKGIFR